MKGADTSRFGLIVAAGACVTLATLLGGCERTTPTGRAVHAATARMHGSIGSGSYLSPTPQQKKEFEAILKLLEPVADSGSDAENAAASLILAQSRLGLAGEPASAAIDLEKQALNLVTTSRAHLSEFLGRSSLAASAEQYDPGALLAETEKAITAKTQLISEQENRKAGIDRRVADLMTQAQQKYAAGRAEHDAYATLRQNAGRLTAIQALPQIEQANARRRAGDSLIADGGRLEAEAEQVAPEAINVQLGIDQVKSELAKLRAVQTSLGARLAQSKQDAAGARTEASAAAATLTTTTDELGTLRSGPLAAEHEKTLKLLGSALSAAQKAQKDSATPQPRLLVGDVQFALGNQHWARAQGLRSYAGLLSDLSGEKPALPNRASYAAALEQARNDHKAALDEASKAYEAAKTAYEGANARGEAKERLQQLGEAIGKVSRATAGDQIDLAAEFRLRSRASENSGTAVERGDAAASPGSPQAMFAAMADAVKRGDLAKAITYVHPENDVARAVLDGVGKIVKPLGRFDAALKSKFGKSIMDLAGAQGALPGMGGGNPLDQLNNFDPSTITVREEGADRAVVTMPNSPEPTNLVKIGGQWKISLNIPDNPMIPMLLPMADGMAKAFNEVAADVESGAISNIDAAMAALQQKMQALMPAIPGLPGSGG